MRIIGIISNSVQEEFTSTTMEDCKDLTTTLDEQLKKLEKVMEDLAIDKGMPRGYMTAWMIIKTLTWRLEKWYKQGYAMPRLPHPSHPTMVMFI